MSQFVPRFIFPFALTSAATLLLFTGSAKADPTETLSSSGYFGSPYESNQFSLPTFDTTLGTLESVTVTFQLNLCPDITVTNGTSAPIQFTNASLNVPVTITGLGSTDFNTLMTANQASGTANPGVGDFYPVRTKNFSTDDIVDTDFAFWENTSAANVTLTLDKGAPVAQGTSPGSSLAFTGSSTQWANVSVDYTYISSTIATPEPSGRYLAGLVAAAMTLLFLRRKNAQRA